MVKLVYSMLETKKQLQRTQLNDRNHYEAKCANLDSQIDALFYELYSLTDEGIFLVQR